MKWKFLIASLIVPGLIMAEPMKKATPPATLAAGSYTAHVKSMPCGGCADVVQKTLSGIAGIEAAQADASKSAVQFRVKNGAKVTVADLQKSLQAASAEMGMGADYSLSNIQKAKS